MSEDTLDPAELRLPADFTDLSDLPTTPGRPVQPSDEVIDQLKEPHRRFCAHGHRAILLIIQGLDASGKNSIIRSVSHGLDPSGFRVWTFGPPTQEARRHDFLWRAWQRLPGAGEVVAFNRSYYDNVLAERLWPVTPPAVTPDWAARHATINHFEAHLVSEGTHIIKCWLHQSREKQHERLLKRLRNPRKQWKFDPSDLRNFRDRKHYQSLAGDTLHITNTPHAPWYIIPADTRKSARSLVGQLLLAELVRIAPDYPKADPALCRRMEAELLGENGESH